MKNYKIQQKLQQLTHYFKPMRIVHSRGYPKGLLLKATEINNTKYLSIAVTNVLDNEAIVYHVPLVHVIGIQRSITPFQRWWYGTIIHKPLPKYTVKNIK
jgi:hypothetical protein